jgi:hypothetical protein
LLFLLTIKHHGRADAVLIGMSGAVEDNKGMVIAWKIRAEKEQISAI